MPKRQDGQAVEEAGRIQGHGQAAAGPVGEDPSQQRGEAGRHVEFAAMVPRLVVGPLVPIAQSFAEGIQRAVEDRDQGTDHGGQAAGASQDHAEAPEGQDGGLGLAQVGEVGGNGPGPVREWIVARHGRTPFQRERF